MSRLAGVFRFKSSSGNDDTTVNSHEPWKKEARFKGKRVRKQK